jgi:pilus assembly protein CpaF
MPVDEQMANDGRALTSANGNGMAEGYTSGPPPGALMPAPAMPEDNSSRMGNFQELKARVEHLLIRQFGAELGVENNAEMRERIESGFSQILEQYGIVLGRSDQTWLLEAIVGELLGFGPIDALLRDDSITEIMVNGPQQVYIEQAGRIFRTNIQFRDEDHVRWVIDRLLSYVGRRSSDQTPLLDVRLPDGTRISVILPPVSLVGPVLTIRKTARAAFTIDELIAAGMFPPELAMLFKSCVEARLNLIVCGGASAGKTVLLNALASFVPLDERIIVVEDANELRLYQPHTIILESRLGAGASQGPQVTVRDLVQYAQRLRPDRLIIGECRAGEVLDMLQLMTSGHNGIMTTCYATDPYNALTRLETMALMAGVAVPARAIREYIAAAVDLVISMRRAPSGARRVATVSEVAGIADDRIVLRDILTVEPPGSDTAGWLRLHGEQSAILSRLAAQGKLPPSLAPAPA